MSAASNGSGAFGSSCSASASFSARSERFRAPMMATAPDPGQYDSYHQNTIAANANVRRQSSGGAFGGRSARNMNLGVQYEDHGASDAPVQSTFSTPRSASPSAAFARSSKDRFADNKDVVPGPGAYHSGQRSPLGVSNRLNRSSSFGGRSKRFGMLKEDETPAPGQFEAAPGAFAQVTKRRPSSPSAGFGSRSSRASPFGREAEAGPAPGAYDSHAGNGAFPRASSPRRGAANSPKSAAFASRSSRFGRTVEVSGGPDPTQYSANYYGSMAHASGKTFNKLSSRGGGGFGSASARAEWVAKDATPGPGAYAQQENAAADGGRGGRAASPRPSSAFASRTSQHEAYLRKNDAPATTTYDAHVGSGMAADAKKSFNKLAGTKSFGSRAARPLERVGHDVLGTPAPGVYDAQDPSRPTTARKAVEQAAARGRGAPTAFSSTEKRDTMGWTGAGRE